MTDPNFEMKPDTPFCATAERSGLQCRPCFNGLCSIKGREQRVYKGHGVHDSVNIQPVKGSTGKLAVETDIEVPFSVDPNSNPLKVKEIMRRKEFILTMALGPAVKKLSEKGLRIAGPWYHHHYRPNTLPDIAALHVHIQVQTDNPMQAKELAQELFKTVDADRLEKLVA